MAASWSGNSSRATGLGAESQAFVSGVFTICSSWANPLFASMDAICGHTLNAVSYRRPCFAAQFAVPIDSRPRRCSLQTNNTCRGSWATAMLERAYVRI